MHVQEPAVRQAAALVLHWVRKDIEAVVLLMADIAGKEEAEDIIIALLQLHGRPIADIHKAVLGD
jgi:hypothetical protein